MTQQKKSFIIYLDHLEVLNDLNDEQAGQLFKAIQSFQKGEETNLSGLMNAIFTPFKNQFIRDSEKYESVINRNRENGKKGGRPKTQDNPKNPVGYSETQDNPKKPDNDNDNDNDNVNVNESVIIEPTPEILENEISLIKTEEERKKVAPKKENKPQPKKFKVPKYESVSFTLDQMRALEERFGSDTEWIIKTLHNYKMSSGKKYKSDYHAIFTWVIDKYLKEKKPQKIGSMNVSNMPKYDFENIPDPLKDFR